MAEKENDEWRRQEEVAKGTEAAKRRRQLSEAESQVCYVLFSNVLGMCWVQFIFILINFLLEIWDLQFNLHIEVMVK